MLPIQAALWQRRSEPVKVLRYAPSVDAAPMATLTFRPAFYTPIHQESNLPDFKQAITDTIQALGTGICKARDGQVIGRNPSRQQLKCVARPY